MQEKESFSFINEKIKEKPLNKNSCISRCFLCHDGGRFGVVATLVFTLVQPRFEGVVISTGASLSISR